jgi:phosphoglycerate dehydrogenase-like enzyme
MLRQEGVFEQLRAEFPQLQLMAPATEAEAAEELRTAVAAWGRLSPSLLAAAGGAPQLRWLHNPRSGPTPGYYFEELIRHPVQVTNARGMFNDQLPMHIITFILTLNRFMHLYRDQQHARVYRPLTAADGVVFVPLSSATILFVGVGESGLEAARLCKVALGVARVIGVDARCIPAPTIPIHPHAGWAVRFIEVILSESGAVNGVCCAGRRSGAVDWLDEPIHPPSEMNSLLPLADFVVLTVPHTPETEGLIGAAQLTAMKRSGECPEAFITKMSDGVGGLSMQGGDCRAACLINIARGATVQLDALDTALRSGEIAGCGLDVFETEPLPKDHGLWTAPGAVITPHVAVQQLYQPGTSKTGRFRHIGDERVAQTTAENIRRFLKGQELLNPVDKHRWF